MPRRAVHQVRTWAGGPGKCCWWPGEQRRHEGSMHGGLLLRAARAVGVLEASQHIESSRPAMHAHPPAQQASQQGQHAWAVVVVSLVGVAGGPQVNGLQNGWCNKTMSRVLQYVAELGVSGGPAAWAGAGPAHCLLCYQAAQLAQRCHGTTCALLARRTSASRACRCGPVLPFHTVHMAQR